MSCRCGYGYPLCDAQSLVQVVRVYGKFHDIIVGTESAGHFLIMFFKRAGNPVAEQRLKHLQSELPECKIVLNELEKKHYTLAFVLLHIDNTDISSQLPYANELVICIGQFFFKFVVKVKAYHMQIAPDLQNRFCNT